MKINKTSLNLFLTSQISRSDLESAYSKLVTPNAAHKAKINPSVNSQINSVSINSHENDVAIRKDQSVDLPSIK